MIRKPQWLTDRLDEVGVDVWEDRVHTKDASDDLAEKILANDRPLALQIIAEKCRGWIREWMSARVRGIGGSMTGAGLQLPLPFPELPPHLEIGVGVLKHQRVMTGPDWDKAEAFWRNRRDQMEIDYRKFMLVYDRIRPLLADDDSLQTGDVIDDVG